MLASSYNVSAQKKLFSNSLNEERDIILLISSYNPDTKRIDNFLRSFEESVISDDNKYTVLLESLSCGEMDDSSDWVIKLRNVINNYKDKNTKAIILLGQEAWAAFSLIQDKEIKSPIFVCYGSVNGIDLNQYDGKDKWVPKSIDLTDVHKHSNDTIQYEIGGMLCVYDVDANLNIIKEFFPHIKNIALITDNTYGGISIQALVMEKIKNYPEYNLITIDSRTLTTQQAIHQIVELNNNTALLVGTWRVGGDGLYYMSSSLRELLQANSDLPTFTLSGSGMESSVIGGYVPQYQEYDPKEIYKQIKNYYDSNGEIKPYFKLLDNKYVFDESMLDKFAVTKYNLPKEALIFNPLETKLEKYKIFVDIALIVVVVLLLMVSLILYFAIKNKKLTNKLEESNSLLSKAKDAAVEADAMKSSFLANMSHEIRTPLNAISGFSYLLTEEVITPAEKREYRDIIRKNTDYLLKLINDILDISRLESGKMIFTLKKCDIVDICMKSMSTITPIKKAGVEYIFNSSVESFPLVTDEVRLMQVIVNFLSNATKFTEKGSIILSLKIDETNNKILISVTDTGCGILPENRRKIFSRFEKINEHQQGFGLGLAISKQIAEKIGGKIYLDEGYSTGTRIIMEHPILSESLIKH